MKLLKIAWRSLWRNWRRTLINISAAGFGLVLTIFYAGMIGGALTGAKDDFDSTGQGHIEITAKDYRLKKQVKRAIGQPQAVIERADLPAGSDVSARVVVGGLISTAHGGQGVQVLGIDPAVEATVSTMVSDLTAGEPLAADDQRGILLGGRLAELLKVGVGNKVRVMAQRADGEVGADLFRVRGLYHALSPAHEKSVAYVTSAAARKLVGMGPVAHQIVVQIERPDQAGAEAARIGEQLGPEFDVKSYGELIPILAQYEDLAQHITLIMGLFIYLLVGLGILNTMLMSVFERIREFGVLMAIGTPPRQVVWQVLGEAFWIATISVGFGLLVGLGLTYAGSDGSLLDFTAMLGESMDMGGWTVSMKMKTLFSVTEGLKAAVIVYVVTLLVGLYPAWRVSKMAPSDAIRAA